MITEAGVVPNVAADQNARVRDLASVWAYATIPSVKEILIVSSWSVEMRLLRRDAAGAWPANATKLEDGARVTLEPVDLTCDIADAYIKTYLA
jgi:hypothetical protein